MKPVAILALIVFAGLTLGADSCTTTTTDKPDTGGGSSSGKERSPRARLGDSITLKGADTRVKVSVLRVLDPVSPGNEFERAEAGKRFVGVVIRLHNVGSTTYDDSPSNGAKLVGTGGERADSTIMSGGECGSDFSSDVTLSQGEAEQGCLPFELKKGTRPKRFQFGLDSGFGPQTGEWSLRG